MRRHYRRLGKARPPSKRCPQSSIVESSPVALSVGWLLCFLALDIPLRSLCLAPEREWFGQQYAQHEQGRPQHCSVGLFCEWLSPSTAQSTACHVAGSWPLQLEASRRLVSLDHQRLLPGAMSQGISSLIIVIAGPGLNTRLTASSVAASLSASSASAVTNGHDVDRLVALHTRLILCLRKPFLKVRAHAHW